MQNTFTTMLAIGALAVGSIGLQARGAFGVVGKTTNSVQDGTSHVTTSFAGLVLFAIQTPNGVSGVNVKSGSSVSVNLAASLDNANQFEYSTTFATVAQRDAAFPYTSPYTFTYAGASSPALTLTPAGTTAPPVPIVTGTSYTRLQGLNVSNDITLTIDSLTVPSGASATRRVEIYQAGIGSSYTISLTAGSTSFTIPANTLLADRDSSLSLYNELRFNQTDGIIDAEANTTVPFHTAVAPEPTTIAGIAAASLMVARRRRVTLS